MTNIKKRYQITTFSILIMSLLSCYSGRPGYMKKTFWVGKYSIGDRYQKHTDRQIRVDLNGRQLTITEEKTQKSETWHLDSLLFRVAQPPGGVSYMWRGTKGTDKCDFEFAMLNKKTRKELNYVADLNFGHTQYSLIDYPVPYLATPESIPTKNFGVYKYAVIPVEEPTIELWDSMPAYTSASPYLPMSITLRPDEVSIGISETYKETWHLDELIDVNSNIRQGTADAVEWRASKGNDRAIIYLVTMKDNSPGYNGELHVFTGKYKSDSLQEALYLLRDRSLPKHLPIVINSSIEFEYY